MLIFRILGACALALLGGGAASAQPIALFGDARLGLAYDVNNDGGVIVENGEVPKEVRAVSRVRFGVDLTGETGGIVFGGSIRADNAVAGEGGDEGQTAGNAFVSGAWGTLTYGDTNGADEQWVGDVPGDFSLTGLTEVDETRFVSNGGSFGENASEAFAPNPVARPTVRYDYSWGGFGASLSTNRDLSDVGVGAGYAAELAGGSWSVGVGYYRFAGFTEVFQTGVEVPADVDGDGAIGPDETVLLPTVLDRRIPGGEQWSAGLQADYGAFSFGMTWMTVNGQSATLGGGGAENLLVGVAWGRDALSVGAAYGRIFGTDGDLETLEGDSAWELTGQYDLGGGATVNGGVAHTYPQPGLAADSATIADFGITMSF
jgi:outer membrane protein OmpU